MSTERREVDMKSANDQQGQPRIVPTRPGWWLVKLARNLDPEVVRVNLLGADLYVSGWANSRVDERPDIHWLAPIPGPAVLAALAEYGEAVAEAEASAESPILPSSDGVWDYMLRTQDKLRAAIRAERDAEREGGA